MSWSKKGTIVKSFLRDLLGTAILATVIFILLETTIQSFVVSGQSMENTFLDKERLLVLRERVAYLFHPPERGDVIILQPPQNLNTDYIKRVIGLPGDTVEIKNGAVYINNVRLDEPYIKQPPVYTMAPETVPAGEYFVLGDNRNNSNDSHAGLGMVPAQNIVGKVWLSIWPPGKWGLISNYSIGSQLANAGS